MRISQLLSVPYALYAHNGNVYPQGHTDPPVVQGIEGQIGSARDIAVQGLPGITGETAATGPDGINGVKGPTEATGPMAGKDL